MGKIYKQLSVEERMIAIKETTAAQNVQSK
jgi:hypothetical protein